MSTRAERLRGSGVVQESKSHRPSRASMFAAVEEAVEEAALGDETLAVEVATEPLTPATLELVPAPTSEIPVPAEAADADVVELARETGVLKTKTLKLPTWDQFAIPPARRGTAAAQRRFNIPIHHSVIDKLNERDRQLVQKNLPKINRSALFAAAVECYSADQARWVGEWEAISVSLPVTTSLQGRVQEDVLQKVAQLRYWDSPDGLRVVNPGPVLAVIVERILR